MRVYRGNKKRGKGGGNKGRGQEGGYSGGERGRVKGFEGCGRTIGPGFGSSES